MSNVNIVVVQETVFVECAITEPLPDSDADIFSQRILKKLGPIFELACFQEASLTPMPYSNNKFAGGRSHKHTKRNFNKVPVLSTGVRKTVIGSGIDSSTRQINAILNKITDSNFKTLFSKLIRITDVSEEELVKQVLTKAVSDKGYVRVLTRCIQHLHQIRHDPVQSCVHRLYDDFSTHLPDELEFFKSNPIEQTHEYDALCNLIKRKQRFLNIVGLLAMLMHQNFIAGMPHVNDFFKSHLLDVLVANITESGVVDILVHAIADFCLVFPDLSKTVDKLYKNQNMAEVLNNKCRFKLLGVIESC